MRDFTLTGVLADKAAQLHPRLEAALGHAPDDELAYVCTLSEFAAGMVLQDPQWLTGMRNDGLLGQPPERQRIEAAAQAALGETADMEALQHALRVQRNRFQLWIVWCHLVERASLEDTTAALSDLADVLIDQALEKVHAWACERDGEPRDGDGRPQRLVVLGLGKLGAGELNLSSDVDLIFAYPEAGETERGKTNQQFFVRLGQQLITALDTVTADGFAFRVDMRLRPFGASGPLAMHFAAMEDYYVTHGRDWERYALIKARPCAGDRESGAELLAGLRPFVYRRYLDFGALDALRDMKARLYAERHDSDDLKLGPGGIRDVEFTAQVQQLVWGGRQRELQSARLLPVLDQLAALDHLDQQAAAHLADGYRFLRNAEHSLQAEADQQTQTLPAQTLSRERLARSLGFADYAAFLEALDTHRRRIADVFADLIGEPESADSEGLQLWVKAGEGAEQVEGLQEFGFEDADQAAAQLAALVTARDRSNVGSVGRERLDRLMPRLLDQLRQLEAPARALARVVPVLKAVMRRSAYLALLHENPATLAHFLSLASRSRWLAQELARHPAFFDALLDQRHLGALPDRQTLAGELGEQVALAEPSGQERVLDALREFKEHHVFNVALAEVRGTLPLMNASDYLTFLAEAMLDEALNLAWRDNAERFPEFAEPRPFAIVGYGKLGGIELGPDSDLDVVFVHDLPGDAGQFLHRLVRRLLHILTVPTYLGALYEVDMRLRPSGRSGTMVSSLESFRDYQLNGAWVWEHQALVRARGVAGDAALLERFEAVRREILCLPRDNAELQREVLNMRRRMAEHHGEEEGLKRGTGGIVDIEFMVQYLVLAHAHDNPELAVFSDNMRILETAERLELLPAGVARNLREAYLALRSEWHRSVLDLPDNERAVEVLASHRDRVRGAWEWIFAAAGDDADAPQQT
ncbi:MAG: bifunctional [glutamate--ammonia ligase]-adenylyl-L-tyrosine phosphorylase/[glutamate--ammonia-ligase] adenylyltransferase [Gammaproteobacteria bacterium]|nr:bifunctional [glutamate--ammonia ligase]-adenylyl-L-tyrosine phosphorylase/[glutamate--ammonia-ligase] adenylyltransferase [Gammaproteobacteria bacterium]